MKQILILGLATCLVACNEPAKGVNGVVFRSPKDYNNYIIDRQKEIGLLINSFYGEINTDLDSAEGILARGIRRTDAIMAEIQGMPAYKGDSAFRNAAIRSFGFYKSLFEKEYPRIIFLHRAGDNSAGEKQESLQQISTRIINEEENFDKDLHNTQKEFAEKNKMKLIDGRPGKKER